MDFFVSPAVIDQVKAWISEAGVSLSPTARNMPDETDPPSVAIVDATEPKQECTSTKLYPGGRISCGVAFKVASRLGINTLVLGGLLDRLKIKVKNCQLGCF